MGDADGGGGLVEQGVGSCFGATEGEVEAGGGEGAVEIFGGGEGEWRGEAVLSAFGEEGGDGWGGGAILGEGRGMEGGRRGRGGRGGWRG